MADAGRRARFAQETKPSRFVTEVSFADDFQCHGASQIDVDRFVSDPHRTATQLDRFPVFVRNQFIMLEPVRHARGVVSARSSEEDSSDSLLHESLAKHAHRTEFHCSGKLITATRADASVLHCRTMVAFHEELGLLSTIAGKSMFRNKFLKLWNPAAFVTG